MAVAGVDVVHHVAWPSVSEVLTSSRFCAKYMPVRTGSKWTVRLPDHLPQSERRQHQISIESKGKEHSTANKHREHAVAHRLHVEHARPLQLSWPDSFSSIRSKPHTLSPKP